VAGVGSPCGHRSGEVLGSYHMRGHPLAPQLRWKSFYTSTGSLDLVYT